MSDDDRYLDRADDGPADDESGESDTSTDSHVAGSRATGGVVDESAQDQGSTTGSTPSGEYVGRVSGQDVGYSGETGAEARAAAGEGLGDGPSV
ncbi:MAG: hypothetical protein ABJA87_07060 [bacterium]